MMESGRHIEGPNNIPTGIVYDNPGRLPNPMQDQITVPLEYSALVPPVTERLGNTELVAEIADAPPLQQREIIVNEALKTAGTWLRSRADIAAALPSDHPVFEKVCAETMAQPPTTSRARAEILADMSRRPDLSPVAQKTIFREAMKSAQHVGAVERLDERTHTLTLLADRQTNPDHLEAIKQACADIVDPELQAQVLGKIASQYLAADTSSAARVEGYKETMQDLERLGDTPALHEAKTSWGDHLLHGEHDQDRLGAWKNIATLPPQFKVFGHIALAGTTATPDSDMWQTIDQDIERHWSQYPLRLRATIIDRLVDVGSFDRAADLALHMIDDTDNSTERNNATRETIRRVAERQAITDLSGAMNTLKKAEQYTTRELDRLIHLRTQLSVRDESSPEMSALQIEKYDTLNAIAGVRTALLVPTNPNRAMRQTALYAPRGTAPGLHLDQFQGAVSEAFAKTGNIEEATRLVPPINRSVLGRIIRARTLAAIANAIQQNI